MSCVIARRYAAAFYTSLEDEKYLQETRQGLAGFLKMFFILQRCIERGRVTAGDDTRH